MTQTSPPEETDMAAPMFPPGRYGRRRERPGRPRWIMPTLLCVALAITGLIATKLYFQYGNDDVSATLISSTNVTDSSITVTFDVTKRDRAAATCTVEAFTYDNVQVGTAQVPVPEGTTVKVKYTLATTARPYVAEVPACQAAN